MKTRSVGRLSARYLLVGAMSVVMIGCGGGGGDSDDPVFGVGDDSNGDGFPDGDLDGDGVVDDLNGDGIEDADLDGDGVPDDLNGDGNVDADLDGDGIPDDFDGNGVRDDVLEVSAENPCGSERGTDNGLDPDTSTPTWDDNCYVLRNGQFANTLYTAGIQRVVYCSGHGDAASVDAFSDGDMGPATAQAIRDYQDEEDDLTEDGIVGASTWGSLQSKLERVSTAPLTGGFDGYAVSTPEGETARAGCDEVLFYQVVEAASSPTEAGATGAWSLAQSAGSEERVPFSVELTAGQLR